MITRRLAIQNRPPQAIMYAPRLLIYVLLLVMWVYNFPPIAHIFSSIEIMEMTLLWHDIVLALLFFWILSNRRFIFHYITYNNLEQKVIFLFVLWALVPLINGWAGGNSNLFFMMRLFAWGALATIAPLGFSSFEQCYNFIKFYLLLHTVRAFYYIIFKIIVPGIWQRKFIAFDSWDFMACTLLIIGISLFHKRTPYENFLTIIVFPVSICVIIVFGSRTLYIEFILALALFWLLGCRVAGINLRKFSLFLGLISLLIFATGIYGLGEKILERIGTLKHYEIEGSASYRITAWGMTIDQIKEKPLLGHGAGTDIAIYMFLPDTHEWGTRTPHNVYLETAVWGGIITVLLFLLVQAKIIIRGLKAIPNASPRNAALLISGISVMLGTMLAATFAPVVHVTYCQMWFYATLVVILFKTAKLQKEQPLIEQANKKSASSGIRIALDI